MESIDSSDTASVTAATTRDERVFLRESTGLVRLMGTGDSVLYNAMITTFLLGAALTFLLVPYAFPRANIWLGTLITGVIGITMMVAYSMLASAMPRSGGDYVFQSRLVHPILGVPLLLWGYVLWMGLWQALSGYLIAAVAISPFATILGEQTHAHWLTSFGTWAATPWGIIVISLVTFAITLFILIRGMRTYLKMQWVLWGLILLSIGIVWVLLLSQGHNGFVHHLNHFMAANGAGSNYYHQAIAPAAAGGVPLRGYSFSDTVGVAPVVWSALAWTMWSVLNAGELKHARKLRSMNIATSGALMIITVLIAVTALFFVHTVGTGFLRSISYDYSNGNAVAGKLPAPPYFEILTNILTTSPVLTVLLALGFIANGIQILIGIAWGSSRVILALAFDRQLPARLGDVSPRYHTPVKALVAFYLIGVVWVFLYNKTGVAKYTLAVTLTSIIVYLGTMLAAAIFPFRAPEIYKASPAARYKLLGVPVITILGTIAFLFNAGMVYLYLANDKLGVNRTSALMMIGGTFVACVAYYLARRAWLQHQGFEPDATFALIPPE